MSIYIADIFIDRGADFQLIYQWTYSNSGLPADLTSAGARFNIRNTDDAILSGSSLLALAAGSGITLGGNSGTVLINVTKAQTILLPKGTIYHDLFIDFANGISVKLASGRVFAS